MLGASSLSQVGLGSVIAAHCGTLKISGVFDPGHDTRRLRSLLRERKVRFDPLYVGGMDDGIFRQLPLPFGIFGRHEMTTGRVRAQHLAL
jgi:hypothetical protein